MPDRLIGASVAHGRLLPAFIPTRRRKENRLAETTIAETKGRHEAELLTLPNVTGVGIGERAGKPVIKVFVTERVPESALAPEHRVPEHLDGFEVDVEEIGDIRAHDE